MDPESLKNLGTLLFWGALFFLMMRFGCFAHMTVGHGHHGGQERPDEEDGAKDPVCGMAVDPQRAAAAATHRARTYYFCSASCRDKFEREPANYASAPTGNEQREGA